MFEFRINLQNGFVLVCLGSVGGCGQPVRGAGLVQNKASIRESRKPAGASLKCLSVSTGSSYHKSHKQPPNLCLYQSQLVNGGKHVMITGARFVFHKIDEENAFDSQNISELQPRFDSS